MYGQFRQIVRELRRAAGLSQAELARRLATTQSAVARWESGAVSPRLETVYRVSHACGLDPAIVWTRRSDDVDRDQIAWHLTWMPRQRLQHLLAMLAFEERAHRARPVGTVAAPYTAP